MDAAVAYKLQNPSESISSISKRFKVPSSTLHDRLTNTHSSHDQRLRRNLSSVQEDVLVDKILAYAKRGTLLTPRHITELAQSLCGHQIGKNWTTKFIQRHSNKLSSRFYRVQDAARIKADTPETREAFLSLVSDSTLQIHGS